MQSPVPCDTLLEDHSSDEDSPSTNGGGRSGGEGSDVEKPCVGKVCARSPAVERWSISSWQRSEVAEVKDYDQDGTLAAKWHWLMSTICRNAWFDHFMLLCILSSIVHMAFEGPELESKPRLKYVMYWVDVVFTTIFAFEVVVKTSTDGLK